MRFLVALASIVLGVTLAAGYIYRDNSGDQHASHLSDPTFKISRTAKPAEHSPILPKIVAPKVVGIIANEQPTVLNADRSHFSSVATAPAPAPVTQGDDDRERRVLVMALQGELSRVGCYEGAVNGAWSASSKAAMFWFLKRKDMKLPVNVPDHAQLNLLKSAANNFCAEKAIPSDFVTKVVREDDVAEGIPNPTTTIQDTSFSEARQRAGLPSNGRVALDGGASTVAVDVALPAPMTVGVVETKKKQRRYRARNRRVENLFKHPLGRY